jgi:Na+-translocating ferredoxin:NAD+ oxidoreductase RnfG subunit
MGYGVLVCNETPGFGDRIKADVSDWCKQFVDVSTEQPLTLIKTDNEETKKIVDSEIVAISGATISSQGVVNIFNNYVTKIKSQLLQKGMIQE